MNDNLQVTITRKHFAELVDAGPTPLPEAGEVAGPTLCSLVSPGTELADSYGGEKFPATSGYAAVFEVRQIGEGVEGIAVGDRVFAMGKHSQYQRFRADRVMPVPVGLEPQVACVVRLMGVSMTTLVTTKARPGERVAVTGLGPVGYLCAEMAQLCGYEVLAAEPDADRRAMAEAGGLKWTMNRLPVEDPSIAGTVALVAECSGHEQAVLDGCKVVRRQGEVVLIGVPWARRTDVFAHAILDAVFHRYVTLRSGWEWKIPLERGPYNPVGIFDNFSTALRWLAEGRIPLKGLLQPHAPAEANELYQALLHRRAPGLFHYFDWR